LRATLSASWYQMKMRWVRNLASLRLRREHDELSATDAWTEIAVGDAVNYALFPCGTVQTAHFPDCG
jgi:hypothetical protein